MGKESWWLGWWKRIFLCRSRSRLRGEEEDKKVNKRRIEEATQKQRKYALQVATATAAAAEAAVSAAHAAAHILRLTLTATGTGTSSSSDHNHNHKHIQTAAATAAIQIQSAFRRYLARKALVALKGVVKLQAIIRGQSVRRRILINFNPFYPSFNHSISGSDHHIHNNITKVVGCKTQRRWDYRMLSKEDVETLCSRKHLSNIQRDRIMMKYSFSHRERRNTNSLMMEEESALPKRPETARHSQCQDLYMNKHAHLFVTTSSSTRTQDDQAGLYSFPRRSFCRTRRINSTAEEDSIPNSPVFRTYMAATESAKAKARSVSTPRERLLTQLNGLSPRASYSDVSRFSPYSCKLKSPLLA